MPIVEFQNVSKSYGRQTVIENVSFKVEQSSITTLIGPNGAGKTTIARLMLGIDNPSSGNIQRSINITSYIPQKLTLNSSLPMNVKSLIKFLAGKNKRDIPKISEFAQLDLLADKQISELSGGQLQRVLLGATLMGDPKLIVLDEPAQGLDINAQQEFYLLLEDLRKSFNIAIFMISHDLHAVMKSSDQVLCLNHHICCSGIPEENIKSQISYYKHHHDHNHL